MSPEQTRLQAPVFQVRDDWQQPLLACLPPEPAASPRQACTGPGATAPAAPADSQHPTRRLHGARCWNWPGTSVLLLATWPARATCLHVTRGRLARPLLWEHASACLSVRACAQDRPGLLISRRLSRSVLKEGPDTHPPTHTHDKIKPGPLPWLPTARGRPFPREQSKARHTPSFGGASGLWGSREPI